MDCAKTLENTTQNTMNTTQDSLNTSKTARIRFQISEISQVLPFTPRSTVQNTGGRAAQIPRPHGGAQAEPSQPAGILAPGGGGRSDRENGR